MVKSYDPFRDNVRLSQQTQLRILLNLHHEPEHLSRNRTFVEAHRFLASTQIYLGKHLSSPVIPLDAA
ncbi:hypothetical protein KPSA3_00050 [Pseudomonas syringae pv. actinidiae]|uniref:Uncharacterized protein n=1 Tax=Pseudomonas syringae pv. actinidiae TaxID=103796 RepID=A0AAN4Q1J5_PSESF|nr:hypothetical protein KPSA3_00050 [Pseudomonas syringae pv. actinidiae]